MAETVQYYLERMIPELEDLEIKGIFTKVCFYEHLKATYVCVP